MYPLVLDQFDIRHVVERLCCIGATAVPILDHDFRHALLEEARTSPLTPGQKIVGRGDRVVRQELDFCEQFPPESRCIQFKQAFQTTLEAQLHKIDDYPLATRLAFNSIMLQKYPGGSLGISAHRDGQRYVNLICILVIAGSGRFHICADRSGAQSQEIPAEPGDAILMRAPGFAGREDRLFHYVTEIRETRYTLGLRQERLSH
ncbi:MAG: hypothetical protein ACE5K1_04330 [Acidiferrobacterales bacterium]